MSKRLHIPEIHSVDLALNDRNYTMTIVLPSKRIEEKHSVSVCPDKEFSSCRSPAASALVIAFEPHQPIRVFPSM